MFLTVTHIGGAENLNLELVSTLGRYKVFRLNRTGVVDETRAAMDAKCSWQTYAWVSSAAPLPLAFNKSSCSSYYKFRENMYGYPDDLRDLSPDETKNTPRDNYTPYPTPYSVRNCQSGGL